MALTVPNTFVTGATAKASEVNDNFSTVYAAIGSQEYTQQNYITDDETVTASLDALDQQVKSNTDSINANTGILFNEQSSMPATTSNQVAVRALVTGGAAESQLFMREENNGSTYRLILGDATTKVWMYRNDAGPGWLIDATVTDVVLALKGGSNDYNVNGGNQAGTTGLPAKTTGGPSALYTNMTQTGAGNPPRENHTHNIAADTAYRIRAAVGTLQYPDMN